METQIFNLIKDISYPALFALIFIILNKAGILTLLVDFFRGKINGNTDKTIHEKLNKIEGNDLHEISGTLCRIERKLEKLDEIAEGIIYIKAKLNGK